jgi:hypothetical protein
VHPSRQVRRPQAQRMLLLQAQRASCGCGDSYSTLCGRNKGGVCGRHQCRRPGGFQDPPYRTGYNGKDATSDYPLSPRIIFDSGATTTMLPATTHLDKRTPASVRISLPNGTAVYATHRGVLTLPTQSGAPLQLKAMEVPSFPAGLLAVRDIAAQHPVLVQERRVDCLRRQPLLRAADVLVPGTMRNGTYELDQRPCHAAGAAAIAPIRPADAVIQRVFNPIAPASLRRLRAFFGDTLAGIQRRIAGPWPTGQSPVTCHPCHTGK